MAIETHKEAHARLEELLRAGYKRVRVQYPDLLGSSRNKVIPLRLLEEAAEDGLNFCISVLAVDHAGDMPPGTGLADEVQYRDMQAVPDLATLRPVPWEESTAVCLADLWFDGEPLPCCPRGLLKRAIAEVEKRGYTVACGHELEFFLLRPGGSGYEQYAPRPGLVYRLDPAVDPGGVIREMEEAAGAMGLPVVCANQEYFASQWEINCRYAGALEAGDDAHLLKLAIKEIAGRHGLVATFIGKPADELGTSGYHLHLSLWDGAGGNAFLDESSPDGLSDACRWFVGGQLEHARGMTAVLAPTINAYKRFPAQAFAPYWLNWGPDNRTVCVRIPRERGKATRIENRIGDGAASAYLSSAAAIFAGLDGIDRRLEPGPAAGGDTYQQDGGWDTVPFSLPEALDALEASAFLREKLGEQFVQAFCALKRSEARRYAAAVTDWELREYIDAL